MKNLERKEINVVLWRGKWQSFTVPVDVHPTGLAITPYCNGFEGDKPSYSFDSPYCRLTQVTSGLCLAGSDGPYHKLYALLSLLEPLSLDWSKPVRDWSQADKDKLNDFFASDAYRQWRKANK